MIPLLKFLLYPISFIYGLVVWFRNQLYNHNILHSYDPPIKTICIGNVSLGGTGKTPFAEYVANFTNLLQIKTTILSRGYKRTTSGFSQVSLKAMSTDVGDEPLQMRHNLPNEVLNFVCEKRSEGIQEIIHHYPNTELVILDDALQHRKIKAGLNILLTDYNNLFYNDYYIPTGTLRDSKLRVKDADLIVVTKCPDLVENENTIINNIQKYSTAEIFFSRIEYANELKHIFNKSNISIKEIENKNVILFTGISNPKPLVEFIKSKSTLIQHFEFNDHHQYKANDFAKIVELLKKQQESTLVITTQKDAVRLYNNGEFEFLYKLPLFYLPIEITFGKNDEQKLKKILENYVGTN